MKRLPSRMGVGASSILLILVVVSLTLFASLALVQARADASLTEKTAASAGAFYDADARAQRMIAALGAKLAERGQAANAQIMHDIQGYHASPEDAARAAKEAGAKALVLYHLVPAPPARLIEPLFLGDAPKAYRGPLKLAQDGMMVSLPAGSEVVTFSKAF